MCKITTNSEKLNLLTSYWTKNVKSHHGMAKSINDYNRTRK
uniref:Uncharacterized protein n=1 Tax=Lepeophtheirus salmonis TaxID=72036 RepID=A0A0K2V0P0_LEPSM